MTRLSASVLAALTLLGIIVLGSGEESSLAGSLQSYVPPSGAVPQSSEVAQSANRPVGHRGAGSAAVAVDPGWLATTAAQAGIPEPALRAYAVATLLVARDQPGCGLRWTTLAGIGYVESLHGTIGGRTVLSDGVSDRRILGPALDGKGPVAAIRATPESTGWHGDAAWDHAVGPLQFIPSTWETWGSDGDGDEVSDPNDLDDAAYAAARYLCADGHRLDGPEWGSAIFSYNHSATYVQSVYENAAAYAERTTGH